jgi:hypothetical protein
MKNEKGARVSYSGLAVIHGAKTAAKITRLPVAKKSTKAIPNKKGRGSEYSRKGRRNEISWRPDDAA